MIKLEGLKGQNISFIDIKSFIFSGGEVSVKLPYIIKFDRMILTAYIKNSDELMKVVMIKDALDRSGVNNVELVMPYIPYARQDRVCSDGESLSISVFARMINSCNFKSVTVNDSHSSAALMLIDRVVEIEQRSNIHNPVFKDRLDTLDNIVVVAPDAGANKKSEAIAKDLVAPFIQCLKTRDMATGKLSGFKCLATKDEIEGRDVVIFDDICDGGGTFLGLEKVISELDPASISVFFTHGIFSNTEQYLEMKKVFKYVDAVFPWHDID